MAATKLQANWTGVTFNSVTFDKVIEVQFKQGGNISMFSADLDRFNTVAVALMSAPTATVTMANAALVMNTGVLAPGLTSSLAATHKDAKLQTGGDILYVLANAVFEDSSTGGAHAQFGSASASFQSISSDGTTNPFTLTRA